jgi:hypothetical protein
LSLAVNIDHGRFAAGRNHGHAIARLARSHNLRRGAVDDEQGALTHDAGERHGLRRRRSACKCAQQAGGENVKARLQQSAPPGGLASDTVAPFTQSRMAHGQ